MLNGGRYLYVGFMCHQTVEKALKAVISADGTIPPKIHTLVRLAELSGFSGTLTVEQNLLLDELFPLNIEARYPSDKEYLAQMLTKQKCDDFIVRTEAFLIWIKKKLSI